MNVDTESPPRPTHPTPSVGRIVHYVSHGTPSRGDSSQEFKSECRAAVIAGIPNPDDLSVLQLCVLTPTDVRFHEATHDEGDFNDAGRWNGTWHWPERV